MCCAWCAGSTDGSSWTRCGPERKMDGARSKCSAARNSRILEASFGHVSDHRLVRAISKGGCQTRRSDCGPTARFELFLWKGRCEPDRKLDGTPSKRSAARNPRIAELSFGHVIGPEPFATPIRRRASNPPDRCPQLTWPDRCVRCVVDQRRRHRGAVCPRDLQDAAVACPRVYFYCYFSILFLLIFYFHLFFAQACRGPEGAVPLQLRVDQCGDGVGVSAELHGGHRWVATMPKHLSFEALCSTHFSEFGAQL